MTVHKGKIGVEDIEFGTGSFTRKSKTGFNITLTKLNGSKLSNPTVIPITDYTITVDDLFIIANATSGAIALTLPDADLYGNRILTILKNDGSSNAITISAYSTQLIDGISKTILMSGAYSSIQLIAFTGGWSVLNVKGLVY